MKLATVAIGVALLGCLFVAADEFRAAYFQHASDDELSTLIVQVVQDNSVFAGGSYLNPVTGLICPHVTRLGLDHLVDKPGGLRIRTVDDHAPPHGPGRGYYIIPRVSILQGLWRWLSRPGLQIELKDDGECFSSVRRGDAI